ncbi:hypothetical protein HB779_23010 (plasmid) [Phyllobacterium sp. 628]|uniref:hypothetical protein n=1 Tax=Phyllobacterium sp. 628 TaxID=2718938 RepID=UPI001662614B|nr:hypothetical protein [Phyllobacterium sp. 628]QND54780.1 hypothetical protein HB779_23010 [Phyllobacterium sp. 628]
MDEPIRPTQYQRGSSVIFCDSVFSRDITVIQIAGENIHGAEPATKEQLPVFSLFFTFHDRGYLIVWINPLWAVLF